MKQNTLNVPTVADISAFFHNSEIIDPQFDDAEIELQEANRIWSHYNDPEEMIGAA